MASYRKTKGKVVSEFFFEEDASSLVKFQNKTVSG